MKTTHSVLFILVVVMTWFFASTEIAYAQSPANQGHTLELVDGRHMKYEVVLGAAVAASRHGIVGVSFADDPTSITYHARMQEFVDNPNKWLPDWKQDEPPAITGLILASPDERVEESLNGEAWIFVRGLPYDRSNELPRFTTSLQDSVLKLYEKAD